MCECVGTITSVHGRPAPAIPMTDKTTLIRMSIEWLYMKCPNTCNIVLKSSKALRLHLGWVISLWYVIGGSFILYTITFLSITYI